MCIISIHTVASAPTGITVVQEGFSSVRVSWSPPTPLGDTTGYRIYYRGGSSGSVDVSGGFTDDVSGGSTDNHLVTGLQIGAGYTITLVATSQHLPSERIATSIELGKCIHATMYRGNFGTRYAKYVIIGYLT